MLFRKSLFSVILSLLIISGVGAQQPMIHANTHGNKGAKAGTDPKMPGGWTSKPEYFPGNILAFEENKGQYQNTLNDWKVFYACNNKGVTILFTDKGVVYTMLDAREAELKAKEAEEKEEENDEPPVFHSLGIEWPQANTAVRIEAVEETAFHFNSCDIKDPSIQLNNIRSFKKLIYHDLYPGIDVEFTFHPESGIKYALIVKPGTDPELFHMRYSGLNAHNGLKIDGKGNLHIEFASGTILDHAPVTKLLTGAIIPSSFVKLTDSEVGFRIDKKYNALGFVIDPWVQAVTGVPGTFVPTFCGMDAANNVYITGIDGGTRLCYTQKYPAAGGAPVWTYTYNQYGTGSWVAGMTVDPAGNTYVGQPKGSHVNGAGVYYEMVCLNSAGVLSYYNNTYSILDIYETLTLSFSCNASTVVEAGARWKGAAGNVTYAAVMAPATGNVGAVSFDSLTGEVYGGVIAPNGNYYCLAVDSNKNGGATAANSTGPYNNLRCYSVAGAAITPLWKYPVGYILEDYKAKSGPKSLSLNGVSAGCAYLYTTDGVSLDQRSLATGVPIKRVTIPGGSNSTVGNVNGGLAVDLKCGYVYVGSANNVYVYDQNLNPIFTYAGLPGIVYDVRYENGFVSFTGATAANVAFVAKYPAQTCVNPLTHVNPTCGQSNGSATSNPTFCSAPYTYLWTPSGQTTATATGLAAGLYTVQVGTGSYCVTVTDTVTLFSASGGTEAVAGTNVLCAGGTNGTANATMTGGTAPFTYSWTGGAIGAGQGTAAVTGLAAGTYTCSVTDNGGCTTTQTVTITAPTALSAPNAPTNVTCFGANNGAITVTPAGGTGAYTYSWTPAPAAGTAATVTGLSPGTYTCTVTDANGCTLPSTATITQPVAVTATSSMTPALCGTTNGTATATGANGIGAYTYSWNPSAQTTQTANNLGAGTYTCTVTDANGCTGTTSIAVTNTGGPSVTASAPTNITCFGLCNGSLPVTATGGVGPYTYSWIPAPGGGQGTATATALCAGTYTCNVTDSQGCLTTTTGNVTQPTALAVTTTPIPVTCFGLSNGSVTGTASGGTPGLTYTWTPAPGGGQGTLNATGLAAGTYTLTVNDANACTLSSTAVVIQPTLLTTTSTPTPATCNGKCNGQVAATPAGGTAAYTYSWNTGCLTATCINVCAGTYTATVTDAHGCTATSTSTVTQPTALALSMFPKPSHCNHADGTDSVSVTGGTPGYTYSWSPGTPSANSSDNGIVAGTYTIHIKDNNGCPDSMTNTIANLPGVLINPVSATRDTCFGYSNGSATVAANGGFPAYTYSWTPAAAIGGGQGTVTATGLIAGTYTCTVTDSAHCVNLVLMTVTQPTPVTLAPGPPSTICISGCTNLSALGGGGTAGYTYTWSQAGAPLASTNVCPVVTTTYTVNCTDSHGCIAPPAQITITVNPALEVVAATGTQVCPGVSTQLNAVGSGGNGGPYNYLWIPATGLNNPNISNPTATPPTNITYTVIVSDNCGTPTDSDYVTLTLFPLPVVNFVSKDTVHCAPVCAAFTGTSNPACASATWTFGDGGTGTGCDSSKHCYYVAGNYSVTYSVIDINGCPGTHTIVNYINALPDPEAAFTASPQPTSIIDPLIYFTNQSTGSIASYFWTFGDFTGASSTLINPTYSYPDTGCFEAILIVTGTNSCTDTAQHPICIQPFFAFYAPNTFTPNGDGVNDTWFPNGVGIDLSNYHLMIFDRWGNLIWETHTWLEGWDGKANHGDKIAQIDTYVWKVDLQDVFHDSHHYIGHCNIIK